MNMMSSKLILVGILMLVVVLSLLFVMNIWFQGANTSRDAYYELTILHMGLLSCEGAYGHLPDFYTVSENGTPLCSWRYSIVPFIVDQKIDFDPNQAWDSPVNSAWKRRNNPLHFSNLFPPTQNARVFAVVDDDSPFAFEHKHRLKDLPPLYWIVIRFSSSNHHWMKPGDISIQELRNILAHRDNGFGITVDPTFFALSADGSISEIRSDVPWSAVIPFVRLDDSSPEPMKEIKPFIVSHYSSTARPIDDVK